MYDGTMYEWLCMQDWQAVQVPQQRRLCGSSGLLSCIGTALLFKLQLLHMLFWQSGFSELAISLLCTHRTTGHTHMFLPALASGPSCHLSVRFLHMGIALRDGLVTPDNAVSTHVHVELLCRKQLPDQSELVRQQMMHMDAQIRQRVQQLQQRL